MTEFILGREVLFLQVFHFFHGGVLMFVGVSLFLIYIKVNCLCLKIIRKLWPWIKSASQWTHTVTDICP